MRYFIGNLIRGEAAEYYKMTCADLASRFGIDDVSAIVPPHITVKTPFERESITIVDDVIALITEVAPMPYQLSGWNHFTTRTIFVDSPGPNIEIKSYVKQVLTKLHATGLPESRQESDTHIHMSVARFLKLPLYDDVWKYIQAMPKPEFDLSFDNLTIFVKEKKEDKVWKILKTFPLTGRQ